MSIKELEGARSNSNLLYLLFFALTLIRCAIAAKMAFENDSPTPWDPRSMQVIALFSASIWNGNLYARSFRAGNETHRQ